MTEPRTLRVSPADAGQRLDRILADHLPEHSRSQLQKAFAADQVTVDGRPRPKAYRPDAGAEIAIVVPQPEQLSAVPQDIPLDVVYEDDDLLVIDKPVGLVVHPAAGHPDGTLVNALMHRGISLADTGDPLRPGIVHRLDRETSGLLVVARTPAAHRALAAQLQDRTLGRIYLALSWGQWREDAGTIDAPIGRNPRDRQRMAVVRRGGREAVTHWEVVSDLGFVQLCRVRLQTGRTHQIRVHFAHRGHPVVGDPVYGDDRRARAVHPRDRQAAAGLVRAAGRQMLHAAELHLRHPRDGRMLQITAPLPRDFADALAGLGWTPPGA
jgi:23S rRNA pseudouridine1911/1915/1917 synthase